MPVAFLDQNLITHLMKKYFGRRKLNQLNEAKAMQNSGAKRQKRSADCVAYSLASSCRHIETQTVKLPTLDEIRKNINQKAIPAN